MSLQNVRIAGCRPAILTRRSTTAATSWWLWRTRDIWKN